VPLWAPARRVLRQLVTEALTLSCIAGALGAIMAVQFVQLLESLSPADTPLIDSVALDGRGLLFALGLSVVLGVLLEIAPAAKVSRG